MLQRTGNLPIGQCSGDRPYFCEHNNMCFGYEEYCSQYEDKIQPCLPEKETYSWCLVNHNQSEAWPSPQCKKACSSRYNNTDFCRRNQDQDPVQTGNRIESTLIIVLSVVCGCLTLTTVYLLVKRKRRPSYYNLAQASSDNNENIGKTVGAPQRQLSQEEQKGEDEETDGGSSSVLDREQDENEDLLKTEQELRNEIPLGRFQPSSSLDHGTGNDSTSPPDPSPTTGQNDNDSASAFTYQEGVSENAQENPGCSGSTTASGMTRNTCKISSPYPNTNETVNTKICTSQTPYTLSGDE
ncbi:hypothetical protein PoB_006517700 [Plakobranchus ocellatus]|uniref:ShKT domain-containing protein n=1 Tax=Plakobranchus ocellatus TaxID=259542 RepID=A0AAV4D3B8_9GAST|nr:hypothetical protein PoB_006517700 [Plakobranchus ocellatus]